MNNRIKGILFDKDGTLFDFRSTWSVWASRFFLDIADGDAALAARLSAPLGYRFDERVFSKESIVIAGTPAEVSAALIAALPGWQPDVLIDHVNAVASEVPQVEVLPLAPFLSDLGKRGLMLGVATNDAEAPARAHLETAGITQYFDYMAGYDSGFGAKPDPGMLHGFCEAVGLSPEQVMMVGDSTCDLIAGRAAGMTTLGVLTGMADTDELAPHADLVVPDIGAIPAVLSQT